MFSYITKSIVRVFNSVVFICIVIGLSIFTVVIGWYNYQTTMTDLRVKASNTADLASISLKDPIWNYNKESVDDIFKAILLDTDVLAIQVLDADEKSTAEMRRNGTTEEFAELEKKSSNLNNVANINREGKPIGRVQIITSTQKVKSSIRDATLLIIAFALSFVIVISSFIWFLGTRIIQRPINALRASADKLAGGNLNEAINTERKDELGSLAVSFDRMRNAIRKKLDDLSVLNSTGEKLAGIHKQAEALETAIKVMNQQTKVQRGSIYLLDAEGNLTLSAYFPAMPNQDAQFPKSFKQNEGIAGKVAVTAKPIFVRDITNIEGYVGISEKDQPRSLLCVPMMDDQKVFGVMNFIGEVDKVIYNQEDEGFALTIARMTVITIKNIQMLDVIEQHNRTLEEKVLARTAELRQKTNDVNSMLQNMCQGIFTIVRGGVIHQEYSAYLTDIFETKEIAQKSALPFLFDNSSIGSDELNKMDATLDSMIGEESMMFQFNSHLLVTEYRKTFADGKTKILELDWNPVLDDNDIIVKLMVTARDVTELKALQLETGKQKEELDIIGQILSISQKKFMEFIESTREFIAENKMLIEDAAVKDMNVINALFRNMHTIKGNARTYGLNYVADQVHEAESSYNKLRSDADMPWDQAHLLAELELVNACMGRYEKTFKDKLVCFSGGDGEFLDRSIIEKIVKAVEEVNEMSQISVLQSSFNIIRNSIGTIGTESIDEVLRGIINGVPSIARQLGKEVPQIAINDNGIRMKREVVPMLRNVFMHTFRNTLDHGLESASERIANGKSVEGHINLNVALADGQVIFTFADDGKGLALEHLRNKETESGQNTRTPPLSDEEVAQLIFQPGVSTAEVVTSVSGRGVGMDAVKKFLNKQNGDILIEFTGPATSKGFRPFRQIINLPAKFTVQQLPG